MDDFEDPSHPVGAKFRSSDYKSADNKLYMKKKNSKHRELPKLMDK